MALGFGGGLVGIIALICAVWIIYDVWTSQKKMSEGHCRGDLRG